MNQKCRPAALVYMGITIAVAFVAGVAGSLPDGFPGGEWPAFVVLAFLGALSHLYPIHAASQSSATYVVANAFLFAAVNLLSPAWLATLSAVIWIPLTVRRFLQRKPEWLLVPAANAGQSILVAMGAHYALSRWTSGGFDSLRDVAVMVAVMAGFILLQTVWVMFLIHLAHGVPLRMIGLWDRNSIFSEVVLLCLGVVLTIVWRTQPVLMLLLVVPLAFIYQAMRGVQLIKLAEFDAKTGLYNCRRYEEQFAQELASASLLHRPLSLVFFDVDFLRDVNNNYGHLAGDVVIRDVAERIKAYLRSGDLAARFGGEEFVVLLPGTDTVEARWMAERIREAVHSQMFDLGNGQRIRCSISGGVATFPMHGASVKELSELADAALYQSKAQGRNRISTADMVPLNQPKAAQLQLAVVTELPAAPVKPDAAVQPGPAVPAGEMATMVAAAQAAAAAAVLPGAGAPAAGMAEAEGHYGLPEIAVVVLGVILLVGAVLLLRTQGDVQLLLILCALAFAAEYFSIDLLSGAATVSLGVAVTMAAAATLGTAGAVFANMANFVAYTVGRNRKRAKVDVLLTNLAILVLSAVLGGLPFEALAGQSMGLGGLRLAAIAVGSALYSVTNLGLVAVMASRKRKISPGEFWGQQYSSLAPNFIYAAACGALMGSAYQVLGWMAVSAFAVPLLIMRHNYQNHIRQSADAFEAADQARRTLEEAHGLQKRAMDHLIEAVSAIIDARDASVYGHSRQVARYAVALAEEMKIHPDEVYKIRMAALLHDLGKVAIPEAILHKPAKLTPDEWEIMKQHTTIGERILKGIPGLDEVARMVGEHHEKYGSKGYPYGLTGEEITIGARIISLSDALDSILSDRPYSKAKPLTWAIAEVDRCKGDHFDPAVVDALHRVLGKAPSDLFVNSSPPVVQSNLTVAAVRQA